MWRATQNKIFLQNTEQKKSKNATPGGENIICNNVLFCVARHIFWYFFLRNTMQNLPFKGARYLRDPNCIISENCTWERSKNFDTWFVVTSQNATKCMFSESTCLKTNFGTYLEFLVQAVAEKSLGKEGRFRIFFAFPAIHAFTKIAITFDRLHRF
jgi:hypothetical protein